MNDNVAQSILNSYDRLADEYARRLFGELQHKPYDRELLNRFAAEVAGRGEVCDMGCGPGHVARYLRDIGTTVFGLDFSPRMVEQARQLHRDISFRQGNMLALDIPDRTLAGIAPFYAIVNIPKESLPLVFREMERVLQPGGLLLLAANALAKDPDPQTTKALVQAASDKSWVVRVGALQAIAKRGDPTLLPSIQGAMSDNKDVVSYRPLRPSSR